VKHKEYDRSTVFTTANVTGRDAVTVHDYARVSYCLTTKR